VPATFKVFISSTWLDLQPERKAIEAALRHLGDTGYAGLEYFGSRHESTRVASLDEVDRSDVYIGILAGRYGSGVIEAEYRRARENGLPRLIYFKSEMTIAPAAHETEREMSAQLRAFKDELRREHIISEFAGPDDLAAKVLTDLHRLLFDSYLSPRLEAALRGELPRAEAQSILDSLKDPNALDRDLLERMRGEGYKVASERSQSVHVGEHAVVISTGNTNIYNVPVPHDSLLHGLPPPPRDFTGRELEIEELTAQVERGGVIISGRQGLGGVGKTALALKLAQQFAPRYPEGQFCLDLKGTSRQPLSAAEAMLQVIRAYDPAAVLPDNESELRAHYESVLQGRRVLLMLDNVSGQEQVEPLIPPADCAVIITSRRHFTIPGLSAISLDPLPPEDARQLLLSIAPRLKEQVDEIAQLCGYLPLALRLAASALAEQPSLSPADYVRRLSDAKTRLSLAEAALTLSYNLLSPELQLHLRALSIFPGTFDAAAAAAVWEQGERRARNLLRELGRYSMLERDGKTTRYSLHDLTRLFAASLLSKSERALHQRRHADYFLSILNAANEYYLKGGETTGRGLALFDLEWPNIKAGHTWAEETSAEKDPAALALCSSYPREGVYVLAIRQSPREQIVWLEAALAAARELGDREAESIHLGNLSAAHILLGRDRRAIELLEQKLVINRELSDRAGEANALSNIGIAHKNLGNATLAIEHYEKALAVHREVGNRRAEGQNLNNIGNAYADLGQTEAAIESFNKALEIHRLLGNLRGEGISLNNLGSAYSDLNEWRRAIELYKRSLVIFRNIGDRRSEAKVMSDLGQAYQGAEQTEYAIDFLESALNISSELGDLRTLEGAASRLGAVYQALRQAEKSLAYYERALALARQAGTLPAVADTLFKMGSVCLEAQDTEHARQYLAESEKLYRQLNSPALAQVSALLGDLESFRGETYRLVEATRRFFKNAGIRLARTGDSEVFRCEVSGTSLKKMLTPKIFSSIREGAVFVRFLQGKEMDVNDAWAIRRQVSDLDARAAVAFVVTDARPTQGGWAQIGTFPLGKPPFTILPIESLMISEGLTSGREAELLRKEIEKRVSGRYDPYFARTPVADAFSFFGREALVNEVLRSLEDGQPVGIFGLRKMGKSSVLKALNARAEFPVASVNLQTVWSDPLEVLFTRIARSWQKWLSVRYEMRWEPPAFAPKGAAGTFVDAALNLLGQIEREKGCARLGVLFDEIEVIVPKSDGAGAPLDRYLTLMRALRGLIDEDNRLSLVVAGLNPSVGRINSWGSEQNPAFNLFDDTYLPPLAADDCTLMVSNIGGQVGLSYHPKSLNEINDLSGGHPFLARQLCSLLYEMRGYKVGEIGPAELPLGIEKYVFMEDYTTDLDGGLWQDAGKVALWGEDGARENQRLLLRLAAAQAPLPEDVVLEGADREVGKTALFNLEQFHFINQPAPGSYAIRFGLLRRWLRNRKLGLE
jgi:tetratricopeptide (TPR) repeat protein